MIGATATLLSPEQASSRGRPLRWWAGAERAGLARDVATATAAWRQAWGVVEAASAVSGQNADDAPADDGVSCNAPPLDADPAPWHPLGDAAGLWCRLSGRPGRTARDAPERDAASLTSAIALALFGARAPGAAPLAAASWKGDDVATIAGEVAQEVWHDWCQRVAAALPEPSPHPTRSHAVAARELLRPGSGALAVTLRWCGATLTLLIAAERVARLVGPSAARSRAAAAPPRPALVSVSRALADRPVVVHARLESFELDLGTLATLRVGDVLRTTHPLDAPVDFTTGRASNNPAGIVCAAFLGQAGGARAIELSASVDHAGATVEGHQPPSHTEARSP